MFPYLHIFGKDVPLYSLMALRGLAFALGYILLRYKKSGLSRDRSSTDQSGISGTERGLDLPGETYRSGPLQ